MGSTGEYPTRVSASEKAIKKSCETSFRLEYNYRASVCKAIHKHLIKEKFLGIEAAQKNWHDMTLEEKIQVGGLEHVRWNAYMRTEGFVKAEKRNDLAKQHHNLVPTAELSFDDLRKDA